MLKRLMAAALTPPIVLILAACGGSSHHTTTTKTSSTKAKTGTTNTPKAVKKPKPTLKVEVRSAATKGLPFGSSLVGTAGELIQFHIAAPDPRATKVAVDLPKGPSTKLVVTASTSQHSAAATITGSGGKPVTLQDLHFSCLLPPAPTVCPPLTEKSNGASFHLDFTASRTTPITINATVGPAPTKPVRKPTSNAVVPPYTITEGVRAIPPGASLSKKGSFTASAAAAKGDLVVFVTHASGKIRGAAQTATITLDQGPGTTITESASVPGSAKSTATVTSSSPIALVLPRFTCYVPPAPTFCPAISTKVVSHKYVLTFAVSPFLPPVIISASVQAG